MTRRVLVTGASGFIGRWSVPELIGRGFEVHAVVSKPLGSRAAHLIQLADARVHDANLFDYSAVDALIDRIRPTHLLHFAWNAMPGEYWTTLENYRWVEASLHLLDAFYRIAGARVVMAGSCAEYDWRRAQVCKEDSSPLATDGAAIATPYATCKVALQKMLQSLSRTHGLSSAWGRVFFQYGPGERPTRLVSSVIRCLLIGQEALCTQGTQVRSFMHVQDVGEAFAAILDSEIQGPINIGSSERRSVADVVNLIGEQMGRSDLIRLGAKPTPPNEPQLLVPDITRLTEQTKWRPKFTLSDGLNSTIKWWSAKETLIVRRE